MVSSKRKMTLPRRGIVNRDNMLVLTKYRLGAKLY